MYGIAYMIRLIITVHELAWSKYYSITPTIVIHTTNFIYTSITYSFSIQDIK